MAHDNEAVWAGVFNAINGSAAGTDVGNRVYRTLAPPDETEPLIVIGVVDDPPDRRFDGNDVMADFDVTIYGDKGDSETTLQAIQKKLLALDGTAVTITGYSGGEMTVQRRGLVEHDDQRFLIRSSWRLYATEN